MRGPGEGSARQNTPSLRLGGRCSALAATRIGHCRAWAGSESTYLGHLDLFTTLRDAAQARFAAGGVLSRHQAQPRRKLASAGKPARLHYHPAIAVAMIGPMPGIVAKRWLSGLLRCQAVSSFSTFATAACASSTCVASTRRTGRARSGKRRSLASRTIAISWLTLRSPAGATTPNSARCARSAFTSVVRCRTSLSLPRCRRTAACCSAVLIGTNRIVGRRTASQIASASAASVLLRLTYAFTLRRHQPDLVAGCLQLPRPVVRRRAGFESNQTTRQFGKEGDDLTPPKPFAQNAFPGRIDAVDLKNVFRQIQPYRLNLAHGWLPSMVRFTDHHSGTDRPQRGPTTPSLAHLVRPE